MRAKVYMTAAVSLAVIEGAARDAFVLLGAQFVAAVQYWIGSSNGSAKKTDLLARPPDAEVIG